MYFLPGYITYYRKDNATYIHSNLHQNTVKLTDPAIIHEFGALVRKDGCSEISTPLTEFLHEQSILVNCDEATESLTELQKLSDNMLLVTIMPTEGCNFRCPYCYESHKPTTLSRKHLDKIQEFLTVQAPHYTKVDIAWFGGEPTLCKDTILETSQLMQSVNAEHSFIFTSSMTTNGYLLSVSSFLEYLRAGITSYQITLDGRNHDKTRPHVSGHGTLDTILNNLIAISKLPQDTFSFHVILRHNILDRDTDFAWYDKLYQLFGQDNRFSVLIAAVGDFGGDSVKNLPLISKQERSNQMAAHIQYLQRIGMRCENDNGKIFSNMCYAGYQNSMVFRSNGIIEKCTIHLDHPQNAIGYIDDDKGIVLNQQANQQWCHFQLKPECLKCTKVITCMNMSCPSKRVICGETDFPCSDCTYRQGYIYPSR